MEESNLHIKDQIDAASDHADKIMHNIAKKVPGHFREGPDVAASGRVGEWLVKWREALNSLNVSAYCQHLGSPSIILGMIDEPGKVWCTRCYEAAALVRVTLEPNRCDCCGKETAIFHEYILNIGLLMIHGNICKECNDEARA